MAGLLSFCISAASFFLSPAAAAMIGQNFSETSIRAVYVTGFMTSRDVLLPVELWSCTTSGAAPRLEVLQIGQHHFHAELFREHARDHAAELQPGAGRI